MAFLSLRRYFGCGFEVLVFIGHPQRGVELLGCSVGVTQGDERVAGAYADPQVVWPAGQVGRDLVSCFVGEAGLGEGG